MTRATSTSRARPVRRGRSLAVVRGSLIAVAVAVAACSSKPSEPAPAQAPAAAPVQPAAPAEAPKAPPAAPDPTRLPEDPVAGKRSEEQWREHMQEEEEERQLAYDHARIPQHRALVKQIAAARARYDRARTEPALAKVRADMPKSIEQMRTRVTAIDHWGVSSRVLPDYAALQATLASAYPDAKLAALKGDSHALEQVRAEFDQR